MSMKAPASTSWPELLARGTVLRTWGSDRYRYARLDLGGHPAFAKLALTDAAHAFCRAEIAALEHFGGRDDIGVRIPRLLYAGENDGGAPWFMREWVEGEPAAGFDEEELAVVFHALLRLEHGHTPADRAGMWHHGRRPGTLNFIARAEQRARELTDFVDVGDLLAIVQRPPDDLQLGFAHGDLTPLHIIGSGGTPWLIDLENVHGAAPLYYDVACCYHRSRIHVHRHHAPRFADYTRRRLPWRARKAFDRTFRWLLADRCIAGYHEHCIGRDGTDRYNHDLIRRDILKKRLY
jgi:hypothetical protein